MSSRRAGPGGGQPAQRAGEPHTPPASRGWCPLRSEHRLLDGRYRLDFAWPDARLAAEVDGYAFHASWRTFQDDRARQNDLVAAGWTVLRFTWGDVCQRPAVVAGRIDRALSASRP